LGIGPSEELEAVFVVLLPVDKPFLIHKIIIKGTAGASRKPQRGTGQVLGGSRRIGIGPETHVG